jgi:Camelysin metallo-endopeptidase
MRSARLTRVGSGIAAAVVGAGLLALGTAAAPSGKRQHVKKARARLVASPTVLLPATRIAPGDRVERLVELRVRGRGRIRSVYFQATAKTSSALDSDRQNGLQVSIDRCTKKWRTHGLANACRGKRKVVLSRRPLVGRTKLKLGTLTPRQPAHLRLVIVFPPSAGSALENQLTAATYRFVAVG